jgi:hypothetical protein
MKTPIFEVLIRVIGKSNSLPNNNNKLTRWRLKTQLTVPRGEGEVVSCTEVAAPMGWLNGERRRHVLVSERERRVAFHVLFLFYFAKIPKVDTWHDINGLIYLTDRNEAKARVQFAGKTLEDLLPAESCVVLCCVVLCCVVVFL